jgi:hypothetical protein
MPLFKIKIPLTNLQPTNAFIQDMKASTPPMVDNFGQIFRNAARDTQIPVQVLYGIAMNETRGQHNSNGRFGISGAEKSTGIMQVSPEMAYEFFVKDVAENRVTPQMAAMWAKYVPSLRYTMGKRVAGYPAAPKAMWNAVFDALKKPEFNIYAGAMVFRRLLEETADKDGTMRLDKAIVKYNIGHVPTTSKLAYNFGDTTSLVKSLNSITKAYILNVVGNNGSVHYYYQNGIA